MAKATPETPEPTQSPETTGLKLTPITGPYASVEKAKEVDAEVAALIEKITEDTPLVLAIESAEHATAIMKAVRLAANVAGRKLSYKAVIGADGTKGIEFRQPRKRKKAGEASPAIEGATEQ